MTILPLGELVSGSWHWQIWTVAAVAAAVVVVVVVVAVQLSPCVNDSGSVLDYSRSFPFWLKPKVVEMLLAHLVLASLLVVPSVLAVEVDKLCDLGLPNRSFFQEILGTQGRVE